MNKSMNPKYLPCNGLGPMALSRPLEDVSLSFFFKFGLGGLGGGRYGSYVGTNGGGGHFQYSIGRTKSGTLFG